MTAVFRRELGAYFKSIMAYLFSAFLLLFAGIYTMAYNLSGYYANFEYAVSSVTFIYLIAVPILTMRSVAEERRSKTDQLLYSLPISLTGVIVGKYLAMLAVLAVPVGVMALYPLILSQFGPIAYGTTYGTLMAFFLLGACLLAIGLFVSSVTESQVSAAVITLVVMLLLYFMNDLASYLSATASASLIALCMVAVLFAAVLYVMTRNPIIAGLTGAGGVGALLVWHQADSAAFSGLFADLISQLSVFDRFLTFVDGVFDVTAIVYYLSIACVFLFLSVQSMEKRRWSE